MSKKSLNVIVCGGSLGGLFAGIVLKRLGHNVRIFERNPSGLLQTQGAGIVAGGDTQAFLEQYDLTHTPFAVVSPMRHYLDKQGNEIHRQELEQRMTSWDLLYNLLRSNFDGKKSDYCNVPETQKGDGVVSYETGHTVTNVAEKSSGTVEVTYHSRDGTQETSTADLVIGTDGPSSTIRKLFDPVERTYAGYVAWRGTVIESGASEAAKSAFVEKFTFFHAQGLQILAYCIPGAKGTLQRGDRLVNWVWYCNYAAGSDEYKDLMTDTSGRINQFTLHAGKMRDEIWARQKEYASRTLPPQFAELVHKTEEPFVQAITDVISSRNSYFEGKVLLLGDAVAGFRPHTAASTSQAAFDALKLGELLRGEIDLSAWQKRTMEYAREVSHHGVEMGQRSQFGQNPFAS